MSIVTLTSAESSPKLAVSPSVTTFAIASVALAGVGLLLSILVDIRPHSNLMTPALVAFPFSVGWTIVVATSARHGKRAMWLLLGFPFAWFYPILTAFFALRASFGGGV
jgi:hypothetical protein